MKKKIFYRVLVAIFCVVANGCSHFTKSQTPAVNAGSPVTAVAPSVDPQTCDRSLKMASYNLTFAKQQAKRAHVYTDWSLANKAFSAAQQAQAAKDYRLCAENALLVNNYIERNQQYIKWRNSLGI